MKDRTPLWMRAGGFAAASGIRAWMNTLDCQALFYDRSVDGIFASSTSRIYVFWHEYLLLPLALRGHCNLTMLLSKHHDADILFRLAHHMGFDCVRGSTYGEFKIGFSKNRMRKSPCAQPSRTIRRSGSPDGLRQRPDLRPKLVRDALVADGIGSR